MRCRFTFVFTFVALLGCGEGRSGSATDGAPPDRDLAYTTIIYSMDWADYDQDGDLDVGVAVFEGRDAVFRQEPGGFTRVWESYARRPFNNYADRSARWFDVDADGDLDLLIGGIWRLRFAENEGGIFAETEELGWDSSRCDLFAIADYDTDGSTEYACGAFDAGRLGIWREGREDAVVDFGFSQFSWRTAIEWIDTDNDDDLDLVELGDPLVVWRNDDGTLEDEITIRPELPVRGTLWALADHDEDGEVEALGPGGVVYGLPPDDDEPTALIDESELGETLEIYGWADHDDDGDLDFLAADWDEVIYLYESEQGTYTRARELSVRSIGDLSWVDYDGDGDLDIAIAPIGGDFIHLFDNTGSDYVLAHELPVGDLYGRFF